MTNRPSIEPHYFEPLLTAAKAAQHLGIHPNTLLLWTRQGRIPAIRMGRRVAFRQSSLNVWVEQNYTGQAIRVASTEFQEAA
jgi:excisionase family DNA binding protein